MKRFPRKKKEKRKKEKRKKDYLSYVTVWFVILSLTIIHFIYEKHLRARVITSIVTNNIKNDLKKFKKNKKVDYLMFPSVWT